MTEKTKRAIIKERPRFLRVLQFWVMLEVILGYIMLGGLISILANKLARRSLNINRV